MSDEIVERVQAAIKQYWLETGFDPSDPGDGVARAAIAAMRVPTYAMLRAWSTGLKFSVDDRYRIVSWQAMIDEVLK